MERCETCLFYQLSEHKVFGCEGLCCLNYKKPVPANKKDHCRCYKERKDEK